MTEPAPIVELQPPDTSEITFATDGATVVVDTSADTISEIVLATGDPDVLVLAGGEGPPGLVVHRFQLEHADVDAGAPLLTVAAGALIPGLWAMIEEGFDAPAERLGLGTAATPANQLAFPFPAAPPTWPTFDGAERAVGTVWGIELLRLVEDTELYLHSMVGGNTTGRLTVFLPVLG